MSAKLVISCRSTKERQGIIKKCHDSLFNYNINKEQSFANDAFLDEYLTDLEKFAEDLGIICRECNPGKEAMLIYEYVKIEDDFGENGRRIISNHLVMDNVIS